MNRWIPGMRDAFFKTLYEIAKNDKNLILITSDTGAICHDDFRRKLKNQYLNVGIAEQNMVGVAAGLAMSGRKVYIYAIVPFVTMRCYEQIRVDLCCMNLDVNIVGIGAGFDYSTLGPTHNGTEDIALMNALPGMTIYSPSDNITAEICARMSYNNKGPKYIRLDRTGSPLIYDKKRPNSNEIKDGFSILKQGQDIYLISTGRMSQTALEVSLSLARLKISAGVIDLFKIKPFNGQGLLRVVNRIKLIVSLEEHFVNCGIGSILAQLLTARKKHPVLKCIGIPNRFCRRYGSREYLYKFNRIDEESVTKQILRWIKDDK